MSKRDWALLLTCVHLFALFSVILIIIRLEDDMTVDIIPGVPVTGEKVEVKQVAVSTENPKVLLVDVEWVNHPADISIIFEGAVVKNETGNVVFVTHPPDIELLPYTETTLNIPLENRLPSGTYTVTLVTSNGGSFDFPAFTSP